MNINKYSKFEKHDDLNGEIEGQRESDRGRGEFGLGARLNFYDSPSTDSTTRTRELFTERDIFLGQISPFAGVSDTEARAAIFATGCQREFWISG